MLIGDMKKAESLIKRCTQKEERNISPRKM